MPFDKDGRWYPPGDKWMIPTPKPTPAPAPAITEPPKPTNNFTAIIQNISNTLKAKMGVPPPYEMPVGDDLQQLTPPEPQEGILPAMLAPLRDVIAKQRERQIEQTAQWVQQHGGSAEAVRTPDYSRIPEVPRQFLAGLGSSLFLGQGVSEQERRQLGAPETTGGKVARAVGGFVGAAPLYSLLAPIGAAAKAQAVKLPIKNIIGRLAVQGAAGGGATVGTAEAIRQGVGLASGEQGITPESAAKSIAGSAAIGAGVGAAFNVAAPYISYAASRLLERFTKKGAVNVGQMASEGYTVQADSPEYQQLLNEGWRTFTKPKTGEAFLFKEGNVKFIVGAGGNIVGKTAPAIPKPLAQLQAGVIPKPVTPAPTIPKPPTTVAALTDAETRLVGLAQQQGRSLEDFESALAKAQQALVDQQVAQLWEYVKHTPGVVKRQRITIPGAVVGEDEIWLGGGSLNDSWYRDFYAAHKRAPRKKELADVARDILSGGYTLADGTEIPPNQQFVQMEGALSAIRSAREKTAAQGGLGAGTAEVAGRAIPEPPKAPTVAGAEETLAGEVKAAQPPKGVLPFTGKQPSIPKSAQTTTATVREDDIVKYLSDHLTGPIRSGRFGGKGILGILKVQSGVIRANVARNLPVISHEVGHYIDEQLNLSGAASGEIIQLGKGDAQEGIGEFMRLYLTDTAKAQAQAPQYYAAFESKLPPKVRESLQTAQRMMRTWIEMPGRAKLHSRIYDEAPDAPQASTLDRFTAAVFDDLYALEKGAKQLAQGRVLPITEDPYKQARLAAGSAAWAEEAVKGVGVLDKDYNVVNESLMKALGPYAKNLDDFVDYAVAKRAQGYEARNMESGFEKDWIDETIQALDSPEMQAAFGRWVKWYDSLLKQLVDVGYLAQDDYVRITGANPDYVHFARIRGDIDSTLKTDSITGKSFGNLPQYIKARTGVKGAFGPPIYNPVATAIADAHRIANVVGRQRVFNATLELTRTAKGMGRIAEEIDAKNIHTSEPTTLAQDHIIRGKENGEDRYIQLDPELYRAFQSLDSKGRGALAPLLNMMNKISSVQRAGMTASNPEFALLVNPLVDQFTAAFYSDNGYIPFVDAIRGIRAIAKNNATYVKMKAAGGSLSAFAAQDRSVLNRLLQQIIEKQASGYYLKHPLEGLRAMSEALEMGTRVGEGLKAAGKAQTGEEIQRGAMAMRDVTQDFRRMGWFTREANKIKAFLGAEVGGAYRFAEDLRKNPMRNIIRGFLYFTIPTLLQYYAHKDDPRYQNLPEWIKQTSWVIGFVPNTNYPIFIPFARGLPGIVYGTIPMAIARAEDEGNLDRLKEGARRLLEETGLPLSVWDGMPSSITPAAEMGVNYSTFQDRPIVPQSEQRFSPVFQYGSYTSELAKKLGEASGWSPRMIDYAIRGYLGGAGRLVTQVADWALSPFSNTTVPKPTKDIGSLPLLRRVVTNPFAQSAKVDELYKELAVLERQRADVQRGGERFAPGALLRYLELSQAADLLSEMRKVIKAFNESPSMSADEKKRKIEDAEVRMALVASFILAKSEDERERVIKQYKSLLRP